MADTLGRTEILDTGCYFSVSAASIGKLMLWKMNVKDCKCTVCKTRLEPGRGYKFNKARYSDEAYGYSGYLCGECVASYFQRIDQWFFNRHFLMLFPALDHTPTLKGDDLAVVWSEKGLSGLAFYLENAPRV
jgi:hypothetical protein